MLKIFRRKVLSLMVAIMTVIPIFSFYPTQVYAESTKYPIASSALVRTNLPVNYKEEISESDEETLKHMFGENWEDHIDMAQATFSITHPIDSTEKQIAWNVFKVIDVLTDIGADFFEIKEEEYTAKDKISLNFFQPQFKNDILQGIFNVYKSVEWLMFAIGLMLAIGEEAIAYGNGKGNLSSFCINVIKAFFFCIAFNFIAANFYTMANSLGRLMSEQFMIENAPSTSNTSSGIAILFSVSVLWQYIATGGFLFVIVYAIVLFILWLRIAIFYAKKVPIMLTMMAKGSIMPFFMVRGSNSTVTQYLQNLGMFFLQIILQFAFVGLGIALMGSGGLSNIIIGIVILFSIDEVDKWVGGINGEADLDKMVSFMHHSQIGKINTAVYGLFGKKPPTGSSDNNEEMVEGGAQ